MFGRAQIRAVPPGLPLLFIGADNCTEDAAKMAAKFDKYMRHFHRKVKDTDGQDKPMWRTAGPRLIDSLGGQPRRGPEARLVACRPTGRRSSSVEGVGGGAHRAGSCRGCAEDVDEQQQEYHRDPGGGEGERRVAQHVPQLATLWTWSSSTVSEARSSQSWSARSDRTSPRLATCRVSASSLRDTTSRVWAA
ncbi:hypothetical protein [Streptomyces sp. S.PNR 29]|uniref:hypothetical protein n=1 Tax=Streptomyces sp. S.PNR 29 TaxID=2973805 RepID=UPI0025B157A9|nr:hypothetical protein [Streptomyces sp. S.PNR 29]MDN0200775.1 hypothetical protein [Streptomyces sp. S.PNR 29]